MAPPVARAAMTPPHPRIRALRRIERPQRTTRALLGRGQVGAQGTLTGFCIQQ